MDFKSKKNPVKREHIFFKSPTAAKQINFRLLVAVISVNH